MTPPPCPPPDPHARPPSSLPSHDWDVVVVGAGPAGALAARQLARGGRSTLLVERQDFPRPKVCGGCLNGHGLAALVAADLGHLPRSLGAPMLRELLLATSGRRVRLPLPGGVAVERRAFDAALLAAARDAGAHVVTGVVAGWEVQHDGGGRRRLELRRQDAVREVTAGLVVLAGGLGSRAPESVGDRPTDRDDGGDAWLGLGAVLPDEAGSDAGLATPGRVVMACGGRAGYAGTVALSNERRDVAAAVPAASLTDRAPAEVAAALFDAAGLGPPPGLHRARWHVSPPLHHRPRAVAGWRLALVGDAAGYVEPFTGEGLGWALQGALDLADLVGSQDAPWTEHTAARWTARHRRRVRARQRACRAVGALLRRPRALDAVLALLSRAPRLAAPWLRRMHAP